MRTVTVFLVLLVSVYCHPVKRSASSSESSEEVVSPSRLQLKSAPLLHKNAPAQTMLAGSDESSDSSDEAQQSDTASEDSADTDENDSESDESEESQPTTEPPFPFETTALPVTDSGRGDNLGYPSDYNKSIIYVDSNKIDQGPSPYKYYEMEKAAESKGLVSKKASAYDGEGGNDIEKNGKVYKALQVQDEGDDASTPEMESQGLDSASVVLPTIQQADLEPATAESESASTGESNSASTSEEEEEEESKSSQSSEETTAVPGAGDNSDSSQSSESQEGDYSEVAPVIITAK